MEYIFLLLVLSIIIYVIHRVLASHSSSNWKEPSQTYLNNIIDNAYFFDALTPLDLIARKTPSKEDYKKLYKSRLNKFTSKEKKHLNNIIVQTKFKQIQPYIVKFKDLENNFPHTLGDIIFLPQAFFQLPFERQVEILTHEKVHVYQRLYPIETAKYIESLGFKIAMPHHAIPRIRTNPDTNSFAYSYNNTIQAQLYNSDTPESIADSSTKIIKGDTPWNFAEPQQDHPFEIMACYLSKKESSASGALTTAPL